MSIFQTSSNIARTSDGAVNFRTTEICADGGQTTGQLKFRWQSSANQFWLPRNSYLQVELEFNKLGTGTNATTNIGVTAPAYVSASPGDCLFSLVQHQINGTLCGSSSEPSVDGIILKRAFMKNESRFTTGSLHLLGKTNPFEGKSLKFMYTPPLGLWNTDSVGGGSHVLSLTTHAQSELMIRIMSSQDGYDQGVVVSIKSIKLMVAHATPETPVAPTRTTVINTIDLNTQSFLHAVSGSNSAQISVPPSSRKIFVSTRRMNLSGIGATQLRGVTHQSLAVSFAGQESPVLAYGPDDNLRKYYDFNRENFMTGYSAFEGLAEYALDPITCHNFAKTTADVSTSATIRITADGAGTKASNVYVSSLSYNAIVLTYNSSGYVEGVNYIVVN